MSTRKRIGICLSICLLAMALLCSCATPSANAVEQVSYRSQSEMDKIESLIMAKPSSVYVVPSNTGPFILQDVYTLGGRTLTSITLPIGRTYAAKGGNFQITLRRYSISEKGVMREVEGSEVVVKINAKKYGLEANCSSMVEFVDIDLRPYGISLAENETLGFCCADDTVCLFCLTDVETSILHSIAEDSSRSLGHFTYGGDKFSTQTIPLNIGWEKSEKDDEESAYRDYIDGLASILREKWQGKYISIIGDSISTFGGVTNSTASNTTIGSNAVYYSAGGHMMPTWHETYWGRLADDLGMNLCCMNAWSGSYVYGQAKYSFVDAGVLRADQLHKDAGTPDDPSDDTDPDLILVYIGINDYNGFGLARSGEIKEILNESAGDPTKFTALMDEWFAGVMAKSENATALVHDVNYNSFDQAYALMLYRMVQAYPDAEILAMGHMGCGKVQYSNPRLTWYNDTIEALCAYFGVDYLDWGATLPIDLTTVNYFEADVMLNKLHPNPYGHQLMEEEILKKLAEI